MNRLPAEIKQMICEHLPWEDAVNLSMVSRAYRTILEPFVFKRVQWHQSRAQEAKENISCLQVVGKHAKELVLVFDAFMPPSAESLKHQIKIVVDVLRCTSRIRSFTIAVTGAGFVTIDDATITACVAALHPALGKMVHVKTLNHTESSVFSGGLLLHLILKAFPNPLVDLALTIFTPDGGVDEDDLKRLFCGDLAELPHLLSLRIDNILGMKWPGFPPSRIPVIVPVTTPNLVSLQIGQAEMDGPFDAYIDSKWSHLRHPIPIETVLIPSLKRLAGPKLRFLTLREVVFEKEASTIDLSSLAPSLDTLSLAVPSVVPEALSPLFTLPIHTLRISFHRLEPVLLSSLLQDTSAFSRLQQLQLQHLTHDKTKLLRLMSELTPLRDVCTTRDIKIINLPCPDD